MKIGPLGIAKMHVLLVLFGAALACPCKSTAADPQFFRISSPTVTAIIALGSDGTITWTNSAEGATCTVARASSLGDDAIWDRYTELIVTSSVTRLRIFDPNPPAGMVLIPAGSFNMGDTYGEGFSKERPVHTVYVSGFYMGKYEVTKAEWDDTYHWAINNGYSFDNVGAGKAPNHPVQTINWYDMVKWCNARSQKESLTPAYYTSAAKTTVYKTGSIDVANDWVKWSDGGYRLPTEAEWEKGARGGAANTRFPWTDYANNISHAKANYTATGAYPYDLSSDGEHPDYYYNGPPDWWPWPCTSPVGDFAPNGYGLYDMAGNVWELCWDWADFAWYANMGATVPDTRGPVSSPESTRASRGGAWNDTANTCRIALRGGSSINFADTIEGFRVVRSPVQ